MKDEPRPQRPRVFVTLGDGLAAGFGPWHLSAAGRRASFPARVARRLGVPFQRPVSSAEEIVSRMKAGRKLFLPHHLTVPGFAFKDLFERRTSTPLMQADDPLATATNLVLGIPNLLRPGQRPLCLLEAAVSHRPTHVLFCLGYDRALEAADHGDIESLDEPMAVEAGLDRLARALTGARLAVTSVPDPFTTPAMVAGGAPRESEGVAGRISARIVEQNAVIKRWVEKSEGASFIDLDPVFDGAERDLFGSDGRYPNAAGHHRMALWVLSRLADPWQLRGLTGPSERCEITELGASPRPGREEAASQEPEDKASKGVDGGAIREAEPGAEAGAVPSSPTPPRPVCGLQILKREQERRTPESHRDLTFELEAESSFCQIALVDGGSPADHLARRPRLEEALAGPILGLVPLTGGLELQLGDRGDDGYRRVQLDLPAPLVPAREAFLRSPKVLRASMADLEIQPLLAILGTQGAARNKNSVSGRGHGMRRRNGRHKPRVGPGTQDRIEASSGGVQLRSSFLDALAAGNDLSAPDIGLELELPPRGDGGVHVDLRLRAAWTLPSPCRLPIPVGGDWRFLSVGATQLLLFLRLTTRREVKGEDSSEIRRRPRRAALESGAGQVDLPTLATLDGDYDLRAEELGGPARDSRHLLGLSRLDLGEPNGRLQPVILTLESPVVGRGTRRLVGFDGEVRFPNRLWRRRLPSWQHRVPTLGVVDRSRGNFLGGLVLASRSTGLPAEIDCRVIAEARLGDESGQLRFELEGDARVALESGTPFCLSGRQGALAGESSVDLGLRLEATGGMLAPRGTISGEERLLSSSRQLFSFRYALPPKVGERILFEYTNHSAGGSFQLTCPLRLLFARSPGSRPGRTPDTVILEGLGLWSTGQGEAKIKHVIFVSRQARQKPYVAILIDGGVASNVEAGQA